MDRNYHVKGIPNNKMKAFLAGDRHLALTVDINLYKYRALNTDAVGTIKGTNRGTIKANQFPCVKNILITKPTASLFLI